MQRGGTLLSKNYHHMVVGYGYDYEVLYLPSSSVVAVAHLCLLALIVFFLIILLLPRLLNIDLCLRKLDVRIVLG